MRLCGSRHGGGAVGKTGPNGRAGDESQTNCLGQMVRGKPIGKAASWSQGDPRGRGSETYAGRERLGAPLDMLEKPLVTCYLESMSSASEMDVTCACGHTFKAELYQSANVTVSPELLNRILTGKMNVVECPSCGARFYVEVPFLYHDMARGEMIWVYPAGRSADRAKADEEVRKRWEELKRSMPAEVRRTLDERYGTVRIVFGMDALVEHIMAEISPDKNPASN